MTTIGRLTFATIAGLSFLAGATFAYAQDVRAPLGIGGHFDYGYGLVVERVRKDSPAGRLGLEPGDVIRAIDGRWLRTEADYRRQLRRAEVSAQLIIRDVRTGKLLRRPVQVR